MVPIVTTKTGAQFGIPRWGMKITSAEIIRPNAHNPLRRSKKIAWNNLRPLILNFLRSINIL